jgi:phage-related protein
MAQKKVKSTLTDAQKVGIGFGLTAAAVTAAGAYFLYGSKQSSQNRKKVKGWVLKAKGDVLEALENAKAITEDEYKALVETASGAYGTVKNATAGEIKDFKKEMSDHWQKLQASKAMKKVLGGTSAPVVKKAVKKAVVKKTVSKAPAKKK